MGGILPSNTNEKEVRQILDELLDSLHFSIKKELGIEDIEYNIIFDTICVKGGYPEPLINASVIPKQTKIEKVVFFVESIRDGINSMFFKIFDSSVFNEVIKIYIKFILIHELVHVQQLKYGMTLEEYSRMDYGDNKFEKEANDRVEEILKREGGDFQSKVVEIIVNKKNVDLETALELSKLYSMR